MATAHYPASTELLGRRLIARWFVVGIAILMLATSVAGFAPAILNPAGRRAPISLLAAVHGLVFLVWLLLFFGQSLLVATGRVALHRRFGLAAVIVLASMIPLGYTATVTMVRRGFDLSGDQSRPGGSMDPLAASIFNFAYLLVFTLLAAVAIGFRRRPAIHKRLMLFANIQLMGAPIAHLMGHLNLLTPTAIIMPFTFFLLSAVARDYLADKRIHPLTAGLAIAMFVQQPIYGSLIGPSTAWHQIAAWLAR